MLPDCWQWTTRVLLITAATAVACVPDRSPCRDDACPGLSSGGATGGNGGSGGLGGSGASGGSSGVGGQGGNTGGTGGGAAGGSDGGSGGSSDAGDAGDAGDCGTCVSPLSHCANGECVACTQDAHCASEVCVDNECVECRTARECGEPTAAHCTAEHACAPCESSADCGHFEDTQICDAGMCVECTASDDTDCGLDEGGTPYVCDVLSRSCSEETVGSAGLCDPCVSDEQCGAGQLCVMQRFDEVGDPEGEVDVGWFCFWREDADEPSAPDNDCANAPPYVDTRADTESISGEEATICALAVTTCAAYKDYREQSCAGLDDDDACGDSRFESDGYCEMFSAESYRCTTPCLSTDDCDPGSDCTDTAPKFCSLQ